MTTIAEQETTIAWGAGEEVVRTFTAFGPHIRRMRKDPAYFEVKGGADWAEFEIPRELFDPMRGRRRPGTQSEAQRAASADRMREMHARRRATVLVEHGSSTEPAPARVEA